MSLDTVSCISAPNQPARAVFQWASRGGVAVAVVVDDLEQQYDDAASVEPAAARVAGRLPPAAIVLVPFALGEVELVPVEE
jgi:hypothetical protein